MAPPARAGLGAATGDPRYLDFMLREWRTADDYLYDPVERLYFRDSNFFAKPGPNGKKSSGAGAMAGCLQHTLACCPSSRSRAPNAPPS